MADAHNINKCIWMANMVQLFKGLNEKVIKKNVN